MSGIALKRIIALSGFGILLLGVPICLRRLAPCEGVGWKWDRTVINPHASDTGELRLDGKTYGNVLGVPPFFLTDIDGGYIVFVRRAADHKKSIVVYDIKDKSVSEYPVDGFNFIGAEIGASGLGGGWERIESIDRNEIVIKQRHAGATIKYTLSRQTGALKQEL